jgi:hypothetical protein
MVVPELELDCRHCTTRGLLASTPEAAVYDALHADGDVLLVLFESKGGRDGVMRQLPKDQVRSLAPSLPRVEEGRSGREGAARMALLVKGLWEFLPWPPQRQRPSHGCTSRTRSRPHW